MTSLSNALRQWGSSALNNRHARVQFDAADAIDDLTLLAWALADGSARYEPLSGGGGGELCVDGMRHGTKLDKSGVPQLAPRARETLARLHRSQVGGVPAHHPKGA
jgi:hypothetical protein